MMCTLLSSDLDQVLESHWLIGANLDYDFELGMIIIIVVLYFIQSTNAVVKIGYILAMRRSSDLSSLQI